MSIIEGIIRQNTDNPRIKMEKKNTIFCDIDGTLFKYRKFETYETSTPELLDGVKEKLDCWCK